MKELSNLIFGNIILILIVFFIFYIIYEFKFLQGKTTSINKLFAKNLTNYLKDKINKAKNITDNILKEYGREDEISTEISRLLLTIEKGESGDINDMVQTSNAINKFKLNENVDLEKYPELAQLKNIGTFTEEEMKSLDNGISISRKEYNSLALEYNAKATGFPIQYIVKFLGLKDQYELFSELTTDSYNKEYEVFEEKEPEINLITSLNRQNNIEDENIKIENKDENEIKEVKIKHNDTIIRPSKDINKLTDDKKND